MRQILVLAFGLTVFAASCGTVPASQPPEVGGPTVTAPHDGIPVPTPAVFANNVGEYCSSGGGDARVEMAFNATVRHIDTSAGRPWVTFEVDAWYTDDLGTEIALWAPELQAEPGQRWLIKASRYVVGESDPSGDVYWCESYPETPGLLTEWAAEYGPPVMAGAGVPESAASPETLAALDRAEDLWAVSAPHSYTVTLSVYTRDQTMACGSGPVRIVVVQGETIQARDIRRHCDVALNQAPSIESAFALARRVAGASNGITEFDQTYGFIRSFGAGDRSVEVSIGASDFTADAYPLATNNRRGDLDAARATWDELGVKTYTATVDVRCFCGGGGPREITVTNDSITTPSSTPERAGVTIDEIFDTIEAHLNADHLEIAYHPELGYPVSTDIDPDDNTNDDEIGYYVLDLQPQL